MTIPNSLFYQQSYSTKDTGKPKTQVYVTQSQSYWTIFQCVQYKISLTILLCNLYPRTITPIAMETMTVFTCNCFAWWYLMVMTDECLQVIKGDSEHITGVMGYD